MVFSWSSGQVDNGHVHNPHAFNMAANMGALGKLALQANHLRGLRMGDTE
jgi:hypothetical protein